MNRLTLVMVLVSILIGATAYAGCQDYGENEIRVWLETPSLFEGGVSFTNECGEPYFSLLMGFPAGVGLRFDPYYSYLTATTGFFSGGQLTLTWPNDSWKTPLLYIEGGVIELWTINDYYGNYYYGPTGVIEQGSCGL